MAPMKVLSNNNRALVWKVQKRILLIERLTHLAAHSSRWGRTLPRHIVNCPIKGLLTEAIKFWKGLQDYRKVTQTVFI